MWWWELRTKRKKEAIYLVTISLQRRHFSSEFHDVPITPANIFQQEIFFNRAQSWNERKVDHDEQDHHKCYIGPLLMSNEWIACFPAGKRGLTKTGPLRFVALSKIIFSLIWKFKTNCIAKSHLLCLGCPLGREHKQKKNPIFPFKSVCVRLRECLFAPGNV